MNSFKRSCAVFSAFVFAYFGEIAINIACGPEPDPYDYYVSFFHNNVTGDAYVPFSFTDMTFLYDEHETASESRINSQEWADHLGSKVKAGDVEHVMYRMDAATDSLIIRYLAGGDAGLPDSLASNTYLQGLARNATARDYFLFSKEVEPYATVSYYSYWDPDPRDSTARHRMAQLADDAVQRAGEFRRNSFLRLRYAYQAARMYHYSGMYQRCVDTYDEYIASFRGDSPVRGWALALKAGALRRLGESAEAAYLFSSVFSGSPERRVQAYKNFHYINVPFEEVLTHARSDEERAAIWAIRGFNNADFDSETIASVYQLQPKSPLVGVLFVREINKLESQLTKASQYYNGGWWTDYYQTDSSQAKARNHAAWVVGFAQQLAAEKRYGEPELGVVGAAYIQWLLGNDDAAMSALASLKRNRLSERLADQCRITELLVDVRQLQAGNTLDETAMLPALQWLDRKRQEELVRVKERYGEMDYYWSGGPETRFNRTATNLYQSVLAPYYMQQKDTAMAALLMWKGGMPGKSGPTGQLYQRLGWPAQAFWQEQLQPEALERLADWGRNGMDRPWAPLLAEQLHNFESDEFWDLLGTAYLRVHDYQKASRALANLSPGFSYPAPINWYDDGETPLWPDPFVVSLSDYPKKFGGQALSKADFANAMASLQRKIKEDPEHAAEYYFQLANAVYQTGAFGNSWQLISYRWSSTDNYILGDYYYSGDFHEARQAAIWFEKARTLRDDPEFQAKCTFMLAKCEQKTYNFATLRDYYDTAFGWDRKRPDPFWVFSQRNKYFRELQDQYADTEFIRAAAHECSYLADFIGVDF